MEPVLRNCILIDHDPAITFLFQLSPFPQMFLRAWILPPKVQLKISSLILLVPNPLPIPDSLTAYISFIKTTSNASKGRGSNFSQMQMKPSGTL